MLGGKVAGQRKSWGCLPLSLGGSALQAVPPAEHTSLSVPWPRACSVTPPAPGDSLAAVNKMFPRSDTDVRGGHGGRTSQEAFNAAALMSPGNRLLTGIEKAGLPTRPGRGELEPARLTPCYSGPS